MTAPRKDPAAVSLGRRGGLAAARAMSPADRVLRASGAGLAAWASLSPEERSAEMKRRAAVRLARKGAAKK